MSRRVWLELRDTAGGAGIVGHPNEWATSAVVVYENHRVVL